MLEGLHLAWNKGFQKLELECDNALLIEIILASAAADSMLTELRLIHISHAYLILGEILEISDCHGLKQIVTELEDDEGEISSSVDPHYSLCFPKLRELYIVKCDGLNESTSLELQHCKDIKCLVDTTTGNEPTSAFTKLESFK
ncbi:hypothetical protein J1N35_036351 [Gossypium stocksii]|uniref:RNase H type-1 domain-containing protein n=1 Tax=Gossypium stocksii TaxID=47602 RepID=A0A9D3UHX5_9ROSI|nr:hypothetical protein J1N35_036351 [Gossypium stocksii]